MNIVRNCGIAFALLVSSVGIVFGKDAPAESSAESAVKRLGGGE